MNALENQGVPMTLQKMRAYLDSPPMAAQFRVNNDTPLGRMERVAQRREQALTDQMVERHDRLCAQATERAEDGDATLELAEERIEGIVKDLKSGRMTGAEAIKIISQIPPILDAVRRDFDSVRADAVAAEEFMQQDPADFEASQVERFPALAGSLPVITEAWLRGESDAPDPLAGPKEPDSHAVADVARFKQTGRGGES